MLIRNPIVPSDLKTSKTKIKTLIIIRFIKRKGNENNIVNSLLNYSKEVLELRIDCSNPYALIKLQVQEFLYKGKRTCNKYKKNIFAKEYYNIVIQKENNNTLFLILNTKTQSILQEIKEEVIGKGD